MGKEAKKHFAELVTLRHTVELELYHLQEMVDKAAGMIADDALHNMKGDIRVLNQTAAELKEKYTQQKENVFNSARTSVAKNLNLIEEYSALRNQLITLEKEFYEIIQNNSREQYQQYRKRLEIVISESQTYIDTTRQLHTVHSVFERCPRDLCPRDLNNFEYQDANTDYRDISSYLKKFKDCSKLIDKITEYKDSQIHIRTKLDATAKGGDLKEISDFLKKYGSYLEKIREAIERMITTLILTFQDLYSKRGAIWSISSQASLIQRFGLINRAESDHTKRVRDVEPDELQNIRKKMRVEKN